MNRQLLAKGSLSDRAKLSGHLFRAAQPFPHVVFDEFLDRDEFRELAAAYPGPDDLAWYRYDNELEKKLAYPHVETLAPCLRRLFAWLNSDEVLKWLRELTQIDSLAPDATYRGGGLHLIKRGGKLDVHADFNIHPEMKKYRRVNLIVFAHSRWEETWKGGCLELWNAPLDDHVKILPQPNRCVVMATGDLYYHGHPNPLNCPPDVQRRSIATYYYSEEPPPSTSTVAHSTVFQRLSPDDDGLDDLRRQRARGRLADLRG